jgi:hypothetical protein
MSEYTNAANHANENGDPRHIFESVGLHLPSPPQSGGDENYRLRSIKRARRTKTEIAAIKAAITELDFSQFLTGFTETARP